MTLLTQGNKALRDKNYHSAIIYYVNALIVTPGLSKIIAHNIKTARYKINAQRRVDKTQQQVAVCGWELSHNSAGRVYTLAKLYETFAEVEIIGSLFPQYGKQIWEPIRNTTIPIHSFLVNDESLFLDQALKLVVEHPYEVVHLSKPRIPNIFIGLFYKLIWGAKVLVDIDDEELAFVGADTPVTVEDYLKNYGSLPELKGLGGLDWTRLAVGLAKQFDGITVSNPALQHRYGGEIIRHARDEKVYQPSSKLKHNSREKFAIPQDKKVVLFCGTPREHKGLIETATTIAALNRNDIVFAIVGDFSDPKLKDKLQAIKGVDYRFIGNQPFDGISEVVAIGDICVLLQDPCSSVSQFQVPAKLSDALGMGLVVLAYDSPALSDITKQDALIIVSQNSLTKTLQALIADEKQRQQVSAKARDVFKMEMSYTRNGRCLQVIVGQKKSQVQQVFSPLLAAYKPLQVLRFLTDNKAHEIELITKHATLKSNLQSLNNSLINWQQLAQEERQHALVSIIIPVYNQPELTQKCIASVFKHTPLTHCEVIIVDNGSDAVTQKALTELQLKFNTLKILRQKENLNFALGCNLGFSASQGDTIVFLNNDTEVTHEWLEGIIKPLDDSEIVAVQPKLLYPDGRIQCVGVVFSEKSVLGYPIYAGMQSADDLAIDSRQYQAVTGACMALRANDFIQAKGFDPIFINGQEDIDLCLRLINNSERSCWYSADAVVYHHEAKTEGRLDYAALNRKRFVERWKDRVKVDDKQYYQQDGFTIDGWNADDSNRVESEISIFFPILKSINTTLSKSNIKQPDNSLTPKTLAKCEWFNKPTDLSNKDICLFVVYAPNREIPLYKKYYLKTLKDHGFVVVLILVVDDFDRKESPSDLGVDYLVFRENSGFDFAAWADIMRSVPSVWKARLLLLANDSMYGPSNKIDVTIKTIRASSFDVVGLTDSYEHKYHLQSYFIVFKNKALNNKELRRFWRSVKNLDNKHDVINHYELEMTGLCKKSGLSTKALYSYDQIFSYNSKVGNPLHKGWCQLLLRGFPFIKVQLLKENPKKVDLMGLNELVSRFFAKESISADITKYALNQFTERHKANLNDWHQHLTIIKESELFDANYYTETYPDVKQRGMDPLEHYVLYGWQENRKPNKDFSGSYYLERNVDVANANMNPFVHWLQYGKGEQRKINTVEVDPLEGSLLQTNNPSVIFISHEASQTGAPVVLLSLMQWIKNNTDINFSIIIGQKGPLSSRFEKLAPVFYMDSYHHEFENELRRFCGNYVQVVYVNTIVSGLYANQLTFLQAEVIAHVHEMGKVFQVFETYFDILKNICNKYIAVSQGSVNELRKRTNIKKTHLTFLKPFIDAKRESVVKVLKPTDKIVIFGCGAVEIRKGFDLFCEVGAELLQQNRTDFKMYWIGSAENKDLNPAKEINKRNLGKYVEWLGAKEYPRDYFEWGDIFLLPSREDPYPLVCMEAAECNMPVICFDERAGGMHSFVEKDAGVVVPHLDSKAMAIAVIKLLDEKYLRKSLGKRAHEKVKERHYVDVIAPQIISLFPSIISTKANNELQAYKDVIDGAKAVSFDIFDTLVTRKLSDPNVVFDVLEYKHTREESAALPLFRERMDTAGKVLGSYKGKVDDITIDEIYQNMSFYKNSTLEKETEIQMCVPHPLGLQLYQYACKQKKAIYIASDMYLDKTTIKAILRKNGIKHWDSFYLSSSMGKKKDTGRLFKQLTEDAQKKGIAAQDILHIGDNWVGDVCKARKSGLRAVHFSPMYEKAHKLITLSLETQKKLSQIGRIWNSFCTQATNLWYEAHPELAVDFYTRLGFELTGPLAAMVAMRVKEQAKQTDVQKIVFMARDGRIIKKAFDVLYANEIASGQYDVSYLHLSRATVISATFENPLTSNDIYFLIEGLHLVQKTVAYFLQKAGLDKNDPAVLKVVQKYFKTVDIIPKWPDLNKLSSMFGELSPFIYECNRRSREALRCYLEQHQFLSAKKVIVVDVGWLLNIQSRLDKFVKTIQSETQIIGSYVGSRDRVNKSLAHSSLLFDSGDPHHYANFIEENTTLFEVLFSAPEPSASRIEIDENSGEAIVRLKKLEMPLAEEFVVAQKLQMGAEYFFSTLNEARGEFFPEQISKDYFFHLFEALVNTDNDLAKVTLGQFEVRLGGHHEFIAYENLVKNETYFEYKLKKHDEYFEPIPFVAENSKSNTVIITSAGLDNGSTRYRAIHLADSLRHQCINSTLIHAATPLEKAGRLIEKADTIIFQRCFSEQGHVKHFLQLARESGKFCLAEMDDLVFPEYIPNVGSVKGGEWNLEQALFVATSYEKLLEKMDGCIVSTPLLKQHIEKRYKLPAIAVRNKVTYRRLREPKKKTDNALKLVYASGTYSHKEDFSIIEAVLFDFLCKYPDVRLSILGAAQVSERLLALPNVNNYPLLAYQEMLDFIAKHDLMLVPLADDIFNRAKSNVKFVECAAVGVPVLASKVGEFALAIKHQHNGLLADSPKEWLQVLKWVVTSPDHLNSIAQQAFKTVNAEYVTSVFEPDMGEIIKRKRDD